MPNIVGLKSTKNNKMTTPETNHVNYSSLWRYQSRDVITDSLFGQIIVMNSLMFYNVHDLYSNIFTSSSFHILCILFSYI